MIGVLCLVLGLLNVSLTISLMNISDRLSDIENQLKQISGNKD